MWLVLYSALQRTHNKQATTPLSQIRKTKFFTLVQGRNLLHGRNHVDSRRFDPNGHTHLHDYSP